MKKILLFILLLLPAWVIAQQATPVNPVQVPQTTLYNEPSTGTRWWYNGATLGWYPLFPYSPPNTVLTGLSLTVVSSTLTVHTGTWRINNQVYTLGTNTNFTLQARDSVYSRYETVYATAVNNGIGLKVGVLSPTPIQPSFGADTLIVGSVLITPTATIIIPPGPANQFVFSIPLVQQSYANPWVRTLRSDTIKVAGHYIFPSIDGTSGQVMQTDGAGNLFWSNQAIYLPTFPITLTGQNFGIDTVSQGGVVTHKALIDTLTANAAHFNPKQFIIGNDTINLNPRDTTAVDSVLGMKNGRLYKGKSSGGITSINTDNGISGNGVNNPVILGGNPLSQNTEIDGTGFNFDIVAGSGNSLSKFSLLNNHTIQLQSRKAASDVATINVNASGTNSSISLLVSESGGRNKQVAIDPGLVGLVVVDSYNNVGLNGTVLFPSTLGTQYMQKHATDSIAKAKADSVVSAHPGTGTVTSVAATGANGIGVSGSPITTSGTLALSLGNITPTSINTVHLPANTFQTPAGTANTDSLLVKIGSTRKLGAISANSYLYSPTIAGHSLVNGFNTTLAQLSYGYGIAVQSGASTYDGSAASVPKVDTTLIKSKVGVATDLALKAPLANPTFTGTVTIPNGGVFGTPTSMTATNVTGLPLTTGVTGVLPVANGGTGTATPGIVAGTNVTVTGSWPNQTVNATSSGVSGSGTTNQVAKFTGSSAVGNSNIVDNGTNVITGAVTSVSGGDAWYFGDSITAGTGASGTSYRWTTLLSGALGLTEHNLGVGGQVASGLVLSTIPTKGATDRFIFFAYGTNEVLTSVSTSAYTTALNNDIANALSKGWTAANIVLVGCYYSTFTPGNNTALLAMSAATKAIATANGYTFVDPYLPLLNNMAASMIPVAGNVHPTNEAYRVISKLALAAVAPLFNVGTQNTIMPGLVELTSLKARNLPSVADTAATYLLAADSLGNIGFANNTRNKFVLNRTILNSNLIQSTAIYPGTYSTSIDNLFALNSKFITAFSSTRYNYIQTGDASLNMNLYSSYSGGTINLKTSGGSDGGSVTALIAQANGGVLIPIQLNMANLTAIDCTTSGFHSTITLFDASGNSNYSNNYTNGNMKFSTVVGEVARYTFGGRALIGTTTDNATDKLQVAGTIISGVAGSTLGTYKLAGNTSGTISIKPQAAAGTYEFDMPTTAGTAGQVLTSQGGAGTAMTWSGLFNPALVNSSAGTLTLTIGTDYEFSGTTTTWTLPAPSGTQTGRAYQITIKNAGSGNITLNSATGSQIYDTALVASLTITPGSSVTMMPDGSVFLRE